ncbi:class II aldolase/adducin family protein [Oceanotoga sp. DSM 15011]|jgi:L-fuculose-phosphate aldolase|uniref:L-fuculose-phosphate aldolase n=1 Tax=Oceanotoga teriensis TaxID=515440 RepID=A0AA45C7D7_9BACT|nr:MULTISPECIES: class II aldolase/adducin family protein [Oceanotoga]MDN5342686.1 L-ribulose-5-phosphate 4-epimerase [Oceanotoga sp.]MDO7976766.1 class II aldolase/adducin family protein [Oceanotoga teriensis]PWJ95276.1 L-fuculose-phosphate aldolase [Oceanotoga teriensis]UYP00601.1 class II aldolase/adducin family protein [Oceanotoga sp. DSM 15011]
MLENLKKEVIRVAVHAQETGLCKHKSGNFSIRDKETNYVVVTPSAVDRTELTVDDMCVLDLDGNVVEIVNKNRKPSSETMMHLEIYKTRDDVFSVAHTHSKMATSFAVLAKPIPAIIYEVAGFGLKDGIVPVAPYGRPGTRELALSVVEPVKRSDMFLLEKHGVVAVGINIDDALLKVEYAEELAEIYFNALLINGGKEPDAFTPEELRGWKYPEKFQK